MPMLSSLTQWSQQHICAVFEAKTEQESLQAITETFSPFITANLNGKELRYTEICNLVSVLRKGSPDGLKVEWLQAVEAPCDASHREGFLGGTYIINGIYKTQAGSENAVEYVRHKAVIVKIESQSSDCTGDSRRIVMLSFVASDFPVLKS